MTEAQPAFRRPGLVVFDNDGVLVDSELLANAALARLLTSYGIPTTTDDSIRDYMGGSVARVRDVNRARHGRELPDDFEVAYEEATFALFRAQLTAVRGIAGVLDTLDAAGVPYCVASSGTHERIRVTLEATRLLDRFSDARIFSSQDVRHGKPEPDVFLYAAEKMGVAAADCVVVEDSPLGVRAAKAAGMRVYGHAAMTPPEQLAAADAVFRSMGELPGLLGA